MGYSYDRRTKTASAASILRLIVDKALDGRSVEALVHAYIDDAVEDWEDENGATPSFESTREHDAWRRETFGILTDELDIEKVFQKAYIPLYCKLTNSSPQSAREVMEVPNGLPRQVVPQAVVEAVASASARRDAAEALALRERAMRSHA